MSREEAIEILKNSTMKDTLSEQWQEAYKMAISALEQEPCDDAISREAVLDRIKESVATYGNQYTADMLNMWGLFTQFIKEMPPVTPSRPKGQWIKKGNTLKCPFCGAKGEDIKDDYCFKFCPNCGAKMVEPQERSDND